VSFDDRESTPQKQTHADGGGMSSKTGPSLMNVDTPLPGATQAGTPQVPNVDLSTVVDHSSKQASKDSAERK
jgi:hypothetical protein